LRLATRSGVQRGSDTHIRSNPRRVLGNSMDMIQQETPSADFLTPAIILTLMTFLTMSVNIYEVSIMCGIIGFVFWMLFIRSVTIKYQ